MIGMKDVAVVYTRNAGTGAFTTVAQADLRCRLAHVNSRQATSSDQRAELEALRNLIWEDTTYVMPEGCQVEVNADGVRWNPIRGTFGAPCGPSGAIAYRRCDVVRQGT